MNEKDAAGHRDRMRALYRAEGLDGWNDYTVLEFLLFYSIGRKDTKALAKELLRVFGSFDRVLDAPPEELLRVQGVGENTALLFKLIPDVFRRYMTRKAEPHKVLDSIEKAGKYIQAQFYGLKREQVYIVCLDYKSKLIHGDFIANGTVGLASVQTRAVAEVVLSHHAAAVIMAHNHPGGFALPSQEDQMATLKIAAALKAIGVSLLDHIIVAGEDFVSMSQSGFFTRKA